MKNTKRVAVICSLLLMGPAVLNHIQNEETVMAVEGEEQLSVIQNGEFNNGTANWSSWNGEGGDSTFTVADEQAQVTVHSIAGMHPQWNIPISWSTQLTQEGVAVEANQRYQLSFDAKSTVARPIVVEYTDLLGNLQANFFVTEEMQTFTHEFETIQAATAHFKYLLGNVQHDGQTTTEEEHTLTFDNVSLKSLGEVVPDTSTGETDWQLTWSDEFDGETLDLNNWTIDIGNGFFAGDEWVQGWGNNEKQSYQPDNVTVADGKLILEAREEQVSDEHGDYDFTSGKVVSRDKFSQAYGRFEASMKLPEGQGYWPAFWMMPQDDTYGGWAASGEIDIMENQGAQTNKIGGAIHYGGIWPNNTYSHDSYMFQEGSTTDFNTYSVEWEPEEIRWYVNDDLYYRTSEWHSENGHYPAPFNQEFFMIMNLAVGGWYGGEPDATTEFPGQVVVDYVRVYEDANADYEAIATPKDPDAVEEPEPDDGLDRNPANWQAVGDNLVVDGSFDDTTTFGDPDNISTWNVFNLANFDPNGGKAAFSVVDNVLNADIQQVGWNWWQIQFFQDLALTEGTYKLAFDMSSEQARDMRVELTETGEGIQVFAVDENTDTYEMIFHVNEDVDSRLLFGFGREIDEVQVDVPYLMTLDNVTLTAAEPVAEVPAEPTPDEEDGEWVYIGDNLIQDGTFEQTTEFGDSQNLSTWNTHNQGDYENWAGLAEFSVIDEVLNAEIKQVGWDWWQIQLFQNVNVPSGTYRLSFDMASESERNVRVELKDSGLDIMDFIINEEMNTYEAIVEIADDADLQLLFGFGRLPNDEELDVPYTITLDNVSLRAVEFVVDEEPVEEEPEEAKEELKEKEKEAKEELKEQEKEAKEKLKEEEKEAREKLKEEEKEAKEKLKEEEKEAKDDAKSEKLPKTATAAWTVGALGLTGITSGAGIKFFKRKR